MFNILIHRIVKNITSYQSCWKWLKLYNLLVSPPCHLNLKFNCSCDLTSTRDGKVNFGWADQVEEMLPWIEVKGQTDKLNNYCVYRWNGRKTIKFIWITWNKFLFRHFQSNPRREVWKTSTWVRFPMTDLSSFFPAISLLIFIKQPTLLWLGFA